MPSNHMEVNPTLELARRIAAYNYRIGKVPPRMNKTFSVWTAENHRREELMRRRTLNQGNNAEYLRQKLVNMNIKDDFILSDQEKIIYNDRIIDRSKLVSPSKATTVDFSPHRQIHKMNVSPPPRVRNKKIPSGKMYLPRLKKMKNGTKLDPLINGIDFPDRSQSDDVDFNINVEFEKASTSLSANIAYHVAKSQNNLQNTKTSELQDRPFSSRGSRIPDPIKDPKTNFKSNEDELHITSIDEASYCSIQVNEKQSESSSPPLRVLTPQQYCIFAEQGRQSQELSSDSVT